MVQETEVFADGEVQAMLGTFNLNTTRGLRNHAMLTFMLQTGIRCGEMVKVKESDIHDEVWDVDGEMVPLKVLRVRRSTTKGKRSRQGIPLNKDTLEALRQWIVVRDELGIVGGPLFCNVKDQTFYPPQFYNGHRVRPSQVKAGDPLTTRGVRWIFSQAAKVAGITKRVHPHMTRHTALTNLYDKTRDLRLVQDVAGHARIQETERYTHVRPTAVARAMGAV